MSKGAVITGVVIVGVLAALYFSADKDETDPDISSSSAVTSSVSSSSSSSVSSTSDDESVSAVENAVDGFFDGISDLFKTFEEGDTRMYLCMDYESNLLMAKDDIDIYIDNKKFYTIKNGVEQTYTIKTVPGTHTIKLSHGFVSASEKIELKNDGDVFLFSIKNHTSKIDLALTYSYNIDDYDDIVNSYVDAYLNGYAY